MTGTRMNRAPRANLRIGCDGVFAGAADAARSNGYGFVNGYGYVNGYGFGFVNVPFSIPFNVPV